MKQCFNYIKSNTWKSYAKIKINAKDAIKWIKLKSVRWIIAIDISKYISNLNYCLIKLKMFINAGIKIAINVSICLFMSFCGGNKIKTLLLI